MTEVLKSNWNYILYDDGGKLLLSVICGSVGLFDRNIYLNDLENKQFEMEGIDFIEKLAEEVRNGPDKYKPRHIVIQESAIAFVSKNNVTKYGYEYYRN